MRSACRRLLHVSGAVSGVVKVSQAACVEGSGCGGGQSPASSRRAIKHSCAGIVGVGSLQAVHIRVTSLC
jgi:hypothetical protein